MFYTNRLNYRQRNDRPKAFWGALIPAAINFVGGLISSSSQARAQKKALEEQQRLAQQQLAVSNQNNLAATLNNYAAAEQTYDTNDYNLKYRNGGTRRLGSNGIVITDGGNARKIGNNTYLLRGGSHEDINETGQTGIGINVGGNQIEAEGGEVAQKKNGSLRIFSAQPILSNGMSPAQAILRGYNKDKVFAAQQRFKKNNHLNDDGSKARQGTVIPLKRVHIDANGNMIDTLNGKSYTASATNGEDVVVTGKANHWKEAGKKDTSSYFDPMGAVTFASAAGAPILNFTPSNIVGSIREGKDYNSFMNSHMDPFKFGGNICSKSRLGARYKLRNGGKAKWGTNDYVEAAKTIGSYLPVIGTIEDGYELYKHPSWENAAWFGLGLAGDIFGGRSAIKGIKSLKNINKMRAVSNTIPRLSTRLAVQRQLQNNSKQVIRNISKETQSIGDQMLQDRFKNKLGSKVYHKPNYYHWMHQTSDNLKVNPIDNSYDYRAYYDSATPWELANTMYNADNGHFTDIGKRPSHPTFSNESKYSNSKTPGGNWDDNVFVPSIWQFGNNGNKIRNRYMNNTGEGYFNGRRNVFPRSKHGLGGSVKKHDQLGLKEEDAKKEALNRRIGLRRIAKKCGGIATPRRRYENGGITNLNGTTVYGRNKFNTYAWDNYMRNKALGFMNNMSIPNTPYQQSSYTPQVQSYLNLMSTPFTGRQSSFKPATQDYIGLGIDTLAALGSGLFTRSAYNKLNFNYNLPSYVDETPVAFDTTYHNEAQRANVERNRINGRNLIQGNTASAQTALSRMQEGDTNAMMELNKLADEKANKEVELRNQNAANEQQVRARNAAARNQYYQNVAQIQNAALEAKNNAALAKAQSIGTDLSGLAQAWSNFATSVENRYDSRQNQITMVASANNPAVTQTALRMGYDFSPETLAGLYNTTNDESIRRLILSKMNTRDRIRYGIK